MLWIPERGRAGLDEELRHSVIVEIRPDRQIARGAQAAENKRDALLLNETAGLLFRPLIPPDWLITLK
jgi:hypothetical protein